MKEQRSVPRLPVRFRSSFTAGMMGSGEGVVVDLSRRGCKMIFDREVPEGTKLEMRLHLLKGDEPIEVMLSVVRWSKLCECGIEFVVMDPDGFDRLDQILGRYETAGTA